MEGQAGPHVQRVQFRVNGWSLRNEAHRRCALVPHASVLETELRVKNVALQVTCHRCERTGEAIGIPAILSRELPPAPQFVLVGPEDGFKGMLAWCTLCPSLPPSVTQIRAAGDPKPFVEMPELLFLPARILQTAIERTQRSGATALGKDFFLELAQQLSKGPRQ